MLMIYRETPMKDLRLGKKSAKAGTASFMVIKFNNATAGDTVNLDVFQISLNKEYFFPFKPPFSLSKHSVLSP
jgi:hypothetical protein